VTPNSDKLRKRRRPKLVFMTATVINSFSIGSGICC